VRHNVQIVGHGSTLRGVIKFQLSDLEAYKVQVPPSFRCVRV
jgi:bisphosphoglycerate-dependent phosphoglycerate mutase